MKKTLFLTLAMFLCLAISAHAFVWDEEPGWTDSNVEDHSDPDEPYSDIYDNTYFGYTGDDYSGYYLGTIEGNTEHHMLDAIDYYLDYRGWPAREYEITKVDDIEKIEGNTYTAGDLRITWEHDLFSGTWTWSGDDYGLGFYAVKGGPEFALYLVDPADTEGIWTTRHLLNPGGNIPEISHFAAVEIPKSTVPEPTTMLLFGTGLLGLGILGRRKFMPRKQ